MSTFVGVHVSDSSLQSQFTQVKLRSLNSKFSSVIKQKGKITVGDLPGVMVKLKAFSQKFKEEEIGVALSELALDMSDEVNFESFLKCTEKVLVCLHGSHMTMKKLWIMYWQIYLNLQVLASAKSSGSKDSSAFLKAATTTLLHTVGYSEKACYVAHINSYLGDDPFLT